MQQTKTLPKHTIEPVISTSEPESTEQQVAISFVVPVMNEEQSIAILFGKLSAQLDALGQSYEVIFVDDGSTDNTFAELKKIHEAHPNIVRVIRFRRNFGKTPALVAGFERCHGEIIFTMDGDLQDDPEEIPNFLAKLDEGYDLVSGWKFPRLDPITKIKAYRREVVDDIHFKLYGEFHRFVPVMAHWRGFRITEIKVRHHPRLYGVSKFGARRFARGLIDLLNVLFLTSFLRTPLRLFGPLGFWTFFIGVLVDGFVVARRIFVGQQIRDQPLLFVGILLMIFGVQFVLTGLQSEMIRHYAFQPGEEYSIRQELD